MGPDLTGMTTAAQADAAWRNGSRRQMQIQSATGTAGGNG